MVREDGFVRASKWQTGIAASAVLIVTNTIHLLTSAVMTYNDWNAEIGWAGNSLAWPGYNQSYWATGCLHWLGWCELQLLEGWLDDSWLKGSLLRTWRFISTSYLNIFKMFFVVLKIYFIIWPLIIRYIIYQKAYFHTWINITFFDDYRIISFYNLK